MDALMLPIQELQDRISLEIPASYVQEENVEALPDEVAAELQLTWYRRENNAPDGAELDGVTILNQLAEDVLETKGLVYDVRHERRGRNEFVSTVRVELPPDYHGAAVNDEPVPQVQPQSDQVPLVVYCGEDVLGVEFDGSTFAVTRNGELAVDDLASPAEAFGAMLRFCLPALQDLALSQDGATALQDYLAGSAATLIDSADVSPEAQEAFVVFYELLTLREFPTPKEV